MYQETLQFYHLWKLAVQEKDETREYLKHSLAVAVQERDEAREHLKHSLAELSRLQNLFDTILASEEQQIPHYQLETTDEPTDHQSYSYNHFSDDSHLRFSSASPLDFVSNLTVVSSPEIHDSDGYSSRSNQIGYDVVESNRDILTDVLEHIGGVLPERGKLLQAVKKSGSLVETIFITGPVPKWRNPPVHMSSQRSFLSNMGKWNCGGSEFGSGTLNRSFSGKMPRFSLMP